MSLKPSEALIRVKGMLPTTVSEESGNSYYICDNVTALYRQGKIDEYTKDLLHKHIETLLEKRFSLAGWLISNGHVTQEELTKDLHTTNGAKLQYTRQNWLNDMVFHFKSKGM